MRIDSTQTGIFPPSRATDSLENEIGEEARRKREVRTISQRARSRRQRSAVEILSYPLIDLRRHRQRDTESRPRESTRARGSPALLRLREANRAANARYAIRDRDPIPIPKSDATRESDERSSSNERSLSFLDYTAEIERRWERQG